jgi:hypothetical protein
MNLRSAKVKDHRLNPTSIIQAATAILAPLITLVGLASRRRRLRAEIRDNLSLVKDLEQDEVLRDHSPVAGWLKGKIVVDVAKLSGYPLGTPKKPIPKSAVTWAAFFVAGFGFLTYYIDRNEFVWFSVFPGIVAFLFGVSILGMCTNRELPAEAEDALPPGAVAVRTETASEQVATMVALASSGDIDERFESAGQVGVVFEFFHLMHAGRSDEGVALTDRNWQTCMLQTWLWRTGRDSFADLSQVNTVVDQLLDTREPADLWSNFMADLTRMFVEQWGPLDPDQWGAASRRRRIARDYDLVILAPLAGSSGYFVTTATLIETNMRFVVHHVGPRWLIAHHSGSAPPVTGWPPTWWATDDPDIQALPDD